MSKRVWQLMVLVGALGYTAELNVGLKGVKLQFERVVDQGVGFGIGIVKEYWN